MKLKRHLKKQRRSRIENKKGDIMALSEQERHAMISIYNELKAIADYEKEREHIKEELGKSNKKEKVLFYSTMKSDSKQDVVTEILTEYREKKFPFVSFDEMKDHPLIQQAVNSLIIDAKRNR